MPMQNDSPPKTLADAAMLVADLVTEAVRHPMVRFGP